MLQAIRDKAKGGFAWAIIIFISIPFALVGIGSYLGVGGEQVAATVGGVDVPLTSVERGIRDFKERLRNQLGENYRADLIGDDVVRAQVTQQLIDQQVLQSKAKDWNLSVSDDNVVSFIKTIPSFQRNGKFDSNTYNNRLKNQGMSQRGFEQLIREEYVMDQFRDAIIDTAFVTPKELADKARLEDQKRNIDYVTIPAANFTSSIEVSEEEIKQYYETHTDKYAISERVKLAYIILELDTIASFIDADETVLKDYYEQHVNEFQVPEDRKIAHILVTGENALTTINEVGAKLLAGDDFAALAKTYSEDSGSADLGGDLGWMSPGAGFDDAFEKEAFALALDTVSDPVKSAFGYHLIKVEDTRSGGAGTYDTFKDEIEKKYKRIEAENQFFDFSEKLANLVYEAPDSLIPAADELGLKVQESDWINRRGGIPGFSSPKVTAAAFSEDVLKDGNNSEMIELSTEKLIVVRVIEHEDEQIRSFDEVAELAKTSLIEEKSSEKAMKAGEVLLEKVKQGAELASEATASSWQLSQTGLVTSFSADHSRAILSKAFSLQKTSSEVVFSGTALRNGDYAVIAINNIENGNVENFSNAEKKAIKARMLSNVGEKDFSNLTADLRASTEIMITPVAVDQ